MKTNKTYIAVLFLLAFFSGRIHSQQLSISGFISDSKTGEMLFGANILVYSDTNLNTTNSIYGTAANNYGYYNIPKLERKEYVLVTRYVGYKTSINKVDLTSATGSTKLNIELTSQNIEIEEILVEGKKIDKSTLSTIDVSPELISSLPSLSGEVDLFRVLEFLPGINKATEVSSGIYVRGSSPDQTLTLVDDVVVYNPSHIGNIASTFNTSAIRDIKLIKGAFPAQYGGRLSSVLDIKLRSGTREKEMGKVGLGLISSFAFLEGPLKENSTYMISGRWLYYDKIQKMSNQSASIPRYNFYDFNAKVNYNLSEESILNISGNFNKDKLYNPESSDVGYDVQWQNTSLSLNWLQISKNSLFLNSSISLVNYEFNSKISPRDTSINTTSYFSNPNLTDIVLKQSAEVNYAMNQKVRLGFELAYHNYDLLYNEYYDPAFEKDPYAGKDINSIESSLFVQNEAEHIDDLKSNIGARVVYFGDRKSFRFEPRASLSYELFDDIFIKTAGSLAHQFLHLIVKNEITLPTDFWYPSTKNIKPGKSVQIVFGIDSYFKENSYQFSAETYYKSLDDLYELKNAAILNPLDNSIEDQFVNGKGEAYGVELFFNKRKGSFTGWVGYTLSWTKRQFDELNNGKVFFPKYDRRHELSLVLTYNYDDNLNFGITWMYATGQRYSLPPGQYIFDPVGIPGEPQSLLHFEEMNTYKYPDYHKLDFTANYSFKLFNADLQTYLSFYNVYNRQNIFAQFVVFKKDEDGNAIGKLKRITLFPLIPSFGIVVKF